MNKELRGRMIELIGMNSANDTGLVYDPGKMRQEFADPLPALATTIEPELRRQNFRHALDESEPFALEKRWRTILHMQLVQFRLMIEEIKLRWRSRHVEVNDVLCLRREHRLFGCERIFFLWVGRGFARE